MAKQLSAGDRVSWNFRGRRVVGTVIERLVERTEIEGKPVVATPSDPRYVLASERTGKRAVRRREKLRKLPSRS